ncbi:MAG: hypothetical protein A2Y91_06980, partial [Chloroflexi bacterium RBG_13_54_8]
MIKAISIHKRKPGMSIEEFQKHYEEIHVPLGLKYFPALKGYRRNYVVHPPGGRELDFDVITEYWYDSMEDYQAAMEFWTGNPDAVKEIHDD